MQQVTERFLVSIQDDAGESELAQNTEAVAAAAKCNPPWQIQTTLGSLSDVIASCSDRQLYCIAVAVRELLKQGADPKSLCEPLLARLPVLFEHVLRVAVPEKGFINDEDLETLPTEDQPAWRAFAAIWYVAIQTLSTSAQMRQTAQPWRKMLKPLSYVYEGAHWIIQMLGVMDNLQLLVIEPSTERGFIVEMDGVADNAQLQILLATLVGDPNLGWLQGIRPTSAEVSVARGKGPQALSGTFRPQWQLWKWTGIRENSQLDAPDRSNSHHWIWSEGTPKEIAEFEGYRVILLGPIPYRRGLGIQRMFDTLEARFDVVQLVSPEDVRAWLGKMATSPDRPSSEAERISAEETSTPSCTQSNPPIAKSLAIQQVLEQIYCPNTPAAQIWDTLRDLSNSMRSAQERDDVVIRLAPYIVESKNDLHAAIIATTCGAMIENGADPEPLSRHLPPRLHDVLRRACRLCDACLKQLPADHTEQQFSATRSALSATMPVEALAWESLDDFYPPALLAFAPAPTIRRRMRSAVPWAEKVGKYHKQCYWLARCLALSDDELVVIIEPDTLNGFEVRLNGIDDVKQLLTLIAGLLVGDPAEGWLDGLKPSDRAISIAQGEGPEFGRDLVFSSWHLYDLPALNCWQSPSANTFRIPAESQVATLPKFDNQRVVLLGPAPDWPRWRAGRTFAKARVGLDLIRKLSESEIAGLLRQLRTSDVG